jgi:hypothetical protein
MFPAIYRLLERGKSKPCSIIEDIKQKQETNRIIADAGLKVRPIKGLTLDYTLGIDQYRQKEKHLFLHLHIMLAMVSSEVAQRLILQEMDTLVLLTIIFSR